MNIKVIKLVSGEEVLSEIEITSETEYVLLNPVTINLMRDPTNPKNVQVGFAPFPIHAPQKPGNRVVIARKHVVYEYEASEDFLENYGKIFGSGIITPPKQLILG